MTIKKLTLCILCLTNAANLATDEDLNNEKYSISTVEENILITKNNWNTSKWGDIYFLFPDLSVGNIGFKNDGKGYSCGGKIGTDWGKFLNFIVSGVIEYKYMFHKYCGINVRLNLNNLEMYLDSEGSFFSLEASLEWIYGRKGKKIFSGSFSPWGVAVIQKTNRSLADDFCKKCWTLGFMLLKYEYDRRFYLNFGKVNTSWYSLKFICGKDLMFIFNSLSIEFGLNIIGVNDWRKKRKPKC